MRETITALVALRAGGKMYFKARLMHPATALEAGQLQAMLGYMQEGYGGPDNLNSVQDGNQWVASWHCYDNCE
jgi:hypothetical protein